MGRSLRPEESSAGFGVSECDHEALIMRRRRPEVGLFRLKKTRLRQLYDKTYYVLFIFLAGQKDQFPSPLRLVLQHRNYLYVAQTGRASLKKVIRNTSQNTYRLFGIQDWDWDSSVGEATCCRLDGSRLTPGRTRSFLFSNPVRTISRDHPVSCTYSTIDTDGEEAEASCRPGTPI